jgi:hypothetical protein
MKLATALICLALLSALASADPRLWETPLAVRQGSHMQWTQCTARNANGEVLVIWADARAGGLDIYAQLLSPGGVPQWAADGVHVVTATNIQNEPAAVAVEGGWVVSWIDYRQPPGGNPWGQWIRAQKLDPSGNLCWLQNEGTGVLLDDQLNSDVNWSSNQVVHDGSGGAIVTWANQRLLAQRILADGSLGWTARREITNHQYSPWDLHSAGDSAGNLYLAWRDYHSNGDIVYVAKVTPGGDIPWGVNGVTASNAASRQVAPRICADGAGGCFLGWFDNQDYSNPFIRGQRLNAEGQRLWSGDGIYIRGNLPTQYDESFDIAASYDGSVCDGMIAVWQDERVNGSISEVFGQKISPLGLALWLQNGVKLCGDAGGTNANPTGSSRTAPVFTSDDAGGAVVVWNDVRNNLSGWLRPCQLYGGRILADGSLAWGESGIFVADNSIQSIAADLQANSGFLVVYDRLNYRNQSLRCQQVTSAGQIQFPDSGAVIMRGRAENAYDLQSIPLGGGRVALVWRDGQGSQSYGSLYYQIVASDRQTEKAPQGTPLIIRDEFEAIEISEFALCSDAAGGFFVIAREYRDTTRITAMHVDNTGMVISDPGGQRVAAPADVIDFAGPNCTSDGHGGCYIFLSAYDYSFNMDLYVIRLNAACSPVWPAPLRLSQDITDDVVFDQVTHPDGSCTVLRRTGSFGMYGLRATRIDSRGVIIYNVSVSTDGNVQSGAAAVTDGFGGIYAAWTDNRSGNNRQDIYASHIDVAGHEVWAHNGIAVCADSFIQVSPVLDKDAEGNLFVFWADFRNNIDDDIYAQKLSPTGAALWTAGGRPVCTAAYDQNQLRIVSDGGSGVFAVWRDSRAGSTSGNSYIYGTHLQGDGAPVDDPYWLVNGNAITDTISDTQWQPELCDDGAGGFLVAWFRHVDSETAGIYFTDIDAQRIRNVASAAAPHPAVSYQFELAQNYPNPFNPATMISFSLPQSGQTRLIVYNLLGEEVTRLTDRVMPAGQYRISFNGNALSSGIYFYRLESPAGMLTRRMLLLK